MDIVKPRSRQERLRGHAKSWGWIVGALLLFTTVTLFSWRQRAPSVEESATWFGTAESGSLSIEAVGTGVLKPREVRWLAAQTPATVQRIVMRAGAEVEADTVIIELASPEAVEAMNAADSAAMVAESELASVRAEVRSRLLDQQVEQASSEGALKRAEIKMQAERRAYELKVIAEVDYRRSEVEADEYSRIVELGRSRIENYAATMRAQVAVSDANLRRLSSEAALRRRQVEALQVTAAMKGVLQQVLVEEGQRVEVGTSLARVARPDTLIAELRIPETQAKEVVVGQGARVDTRLGVVLGRVSRVDPAVEGGNVAVDIEFTEKLPAGARPDLSVEGAVVIALLDQVVHVPKPAAAAPGATGSVFRLDPDGRTARRVPVRYGRASSRAIEVVEGLQPGNRIVLSDVSRFERYDALNIK